jgi:4a-hydroxytetrahydrobiopterin dehydratase
MIISNELKKIPQWKLKGKSLQRTVKFGSFMSALFFVNNVAEIAEKCKHHPDVMLKGGEATFILTTHEKGKVTEKDIGLAKSIDKLGV